MKKALLGIALTLATSLSFAQCEPMFDFGDEPFGVAPDTITNLASGEVDVLYIQQVDVKVPADGSFIDFPFVTVDSAAILNITGMPAGLSIECNENAFYECTFLGGTTGCGVISGIPEAPGLYELDIEIEIYTTLGAFPLLFEGYEILIEGTIGVDDREVVSGFTLAPNPADQNVSIFANSSESMTGTIRIFDLVGKQVMSENVQLSAGENRMDFDTTTLPEGVYICRLDAEHVSQAKRLIVVH